MESQPQNPEFRNNPENLHPCFMSTKWTVRTGAIATVLETMEEVNITGNDDYSRRALSGIESKILKHILD